MFQLAKAADPLLAVLKCVGRPEDGAMGHDDIEFVIIVVTLHSAVPPAQIRFEDFGGLGCECRSGCRAIVSRDALLFARPFRER